MGLKSEEEPTEKERDGTHFSVKTRRSLAARNWVRSRQLANEHCSSGKVHVRKRRKGVGVR